jgi:hypothetical protein
MSKIPEDNEQTQHECVKCRKKFDVVMPKCEIIDMPTVTIIAWAHPLPEICPYCGQAHQFRIINLKGFMVDWVGIKTEGQPVVITGGSDKVQ